MKYCSDFIPWKRSLCTCVPTNWVSMSEPHTRVLSVQYIHTLVCTLRPAQQAQCVTGTAYHYCHHMHLLSRPILHAIPSSTKYVQQWDHAWGHQQRERGNDSHWDLGWKSYCIALPTHCYLARTRPTLFYVHLVLMELDITYTLQNNPKSCQTMCSAHFTAPI